MREIYIKHLKKVPFLWDNFSEKFLERLTAKVKELKFGPDEVIVKRENKESAFYFIISGTVEVSVNLGNSRIKKIGELSER